MGKNVWWWIIGIIIVVGIVWFATGGNFGSSVTDSIVTTSTAPAVTPAK